LKALQIKGRKAGRRILKNGSVAQSSEIESKDAQIINETEKEDDETIEKDDKTDKVDNTTEKEDNKSEKNDDKSDDGENNTEKDETTEKDEKTENQNETVKDDNSNGSPSHRPETSKSNTDSENSKTTKKTKTEVEEKMGNTKTSHLSKDSKEQYNIEMTQSRFILFEDEAYQSEHKVNGIDVANFLILLKQFFEERDNLVVLDHLHEYDEQIEETFRAATDVHYDPFKQKLVKTLDQYENTLIKGDFRDQKEKEVTQQIIQDLKDQISRIDETRGESTGTDRESKKQPLSIDELRRRGLRELFDFYAKQHLPQGLEFGDILDKKEVIDLGEFCIFARDFDMKLQKKKMIEIFKKTSDFRHQPLNFKQFCEVIDKIGVAMNQERLYNIKKRLNELEKIEQENQPKKDVGTKKNEVEGEGKSDAEGDDEDAKSKESDKKDDSDSGDSDDDSPTKKSKTNAQSDSESKIQASNTRSVKFDNDDDDKSGDDSQSESEEETDPIKIERKKLQKDLEKYSNYGYNETHAEIMDFLQVHDHTKYRLRAKGVHVIPFFMKGKYPGQKSSSSKHSNPNGSDIRIKKKDNQSKDLKRKMIYEKEKQERIKQYKKRTRNQPMQGDAKGVFNTMSPGRMQNNINGNLLQQNKANVGIKPRDNPSQRVTLEALQQMNLKDFNSNKHNDFKVKDILAEDDNLDFESSAFNYFFPDSKKKLKGKKSTSNKFNVKKAVVKDPMEHVQAEEEPNHYYSEHDKKSMKKSAKKLGNLTSRISEPSQHKDSSTRRGQVKAPLTHRKSNKSSGRSKSMSKNKGLSRKKSSQKSKMLTRAAQIDKKQKLGEKQSMNKVLKMHDNQIKKGMKVLSKR